MRTLSRRSLVGPLVRWALAGLPLAAGCGDFQFNLAVNSTAEVLKRGSKSLDEEPDVKLARDALPGTIKTIDSFLAAAPAQPVLLELTAQAYAQYAFGFLEDDLEALGPKGADTPQGKELVARATGLYDRAYEVGVRMVALDDGSFPKAVKGDLNQLDAALKKLPKSSARGLYWAGFALGSSINLHRDDVDKVADLPRAVALLTRAHELDPAIYFHGPALTLGVVYASQGKAMGGDPDKAKAMFDEVLGATSNHFLMAKVLEARFYAVVKPNPDGLAGDKALYDSLLKEVLATPASVMPEQRLANELAKIKAARYLAQEEDLF